MSGDVTLQALKRQTFLQDRDTAGDPNGTVIAGQDYDDVFFTGGTISGVDISGLANPLAISDGGTGASDAATARTNLGLGSAAVQADTYFLQTANNLSDLNNAATALANLGFDGSATIELPYNGLRLYDLDGSNYITFQFDGSLSVNRTLSINTGSTDKAITLGGDITTTVDTTISSFGATLVDDSNASAARTTLGLGDIATQNASSVTITGGDISGITDLAVTDGGTGASDAGGARTNLGLGTISTQDANNVSISGGSITGISDLAIADGGTGASTDSGARTNLDVYSKSEVDAAIAAAAPGMKGCYLTKSANQAIANATTTTLTWDQEVYDTDSFHDNVTNNSRITIPSTYNNKYVEFNIAVDWNTNGIGYRGVYLYKNGSVYTQFQNYTGAFSATDTPQAIKTPPVQVATGDYFEVKVDHNSGTSRDIVYTYNCWFALKVVGA